MRLVKEEDFDGGYIKIRRKLLGSAIWQNIHDWRLAETILLLANFRPGVFMPRDGKPIPIPRGHLVTSLATLSDVSHLSIRNCRTSLKHLEFSDFLTNTSTSHYRILSVVNYDKYQDDSRSSDTPSDKDLTKTRQGLDNDRRKDRRIEGEEGTTTAIYEDTQIPASKKFSAPTLDELRAYCQERKNRIDPEKFLNYYTANGWRVGRNPMKNWQAAVRTWEKNDYGPGHKQDNQKLIVGDAAPVPGKYAHLG